MLFSPCKQAKLNTVKNKRPTLEDLIWKGSLLPNKYNFAVRNDIRSELQHLDKSWTKANNILSERVNHVTKLYTHWEACCSELDSVESWVDGVCVILDNEQKTKLRDGEKLQTFLVKFQVTRFTFMKKANRSLIISSSTVMIMLGSATITALWG